MLKQLTLAAAVAVGAVTMIGTGAQPAAADHRGPAPIVKVDYYGPGYDHRVDRRFTRAERRFLRKVRRGRVACFKKRPYRYSRYDRRGYRYHRVRGKRLSFRAVRRLVRLDRRYVMRCFRRA